MARATRLRGLVAAPERGERDDGFDEGGVTEHVSATIPTDFCIF